MKIFEIIGEIDTIALKISYGETWRGLRLTPPFHINADSQREAVDIAKQIIDPLQMCTMHIQATEKPLLPQTELAQLGAALSMAADVLSGPDGRDADYNPLYSLAGAVASVLGVDLDAMIEGDEL
jgi:hypothetical protein